VCIRRIPLQHDDANTVLQYSKTSDPNRSKARHQDMFVVVLISFFGRASSYVPMLHARSIYQPGVLWESALKMELPVDLKGGSYVSSE
jgi:hypothetical protein